MLILTISGRRRCWWWRPVVVIEEGIVSALRPLVTVVDALLVPPNASAQLMKEEDSIG